MTRERKLDVERGQENSFKPDSDWAYIQVLLLLDMKLWVHHISLYFPSLWEMEMLNVHLIEMLWQL